MPTNHQVVSSLSRSLQTIVSSIALLGLVAADSGQAQSPRIPGAINNAVRSSIEGSQPMRARAATDAGTLPNSTTLQGMTIVFNRTAEQEASLQQLLAAQQNPASAQYHQWLTPEQFAASYGLSDADISTVSTWLQQEGFTVQGVARSKTQIRFSGTAAQVRSAFGSELHNYTSNGKTRFAPSANLSVPTALSPVVLTVRNVSSFKPQPHVIFKSKASQTKPGFTSSQSGNHYLGPKDVATIYDINPAYNAGYTGSGQAIAVLGQSEISLSDIEHFQTAAGFTVKDPTLVLVPGSGSAAYSTGDEAESDLDVEYSSTIGKGATIYFVYVGNNQNYDVFDSLEYAVDNNLSSILTLSYGDCEADFGSADYASLNSILEQGAAEGETIINSSGDSGSTACYGDTGLSAAVQEGLAVSFPASSQYVTGLGGTEFPSSDVSSSNGTYWQSASGSDVISSALSYIPEQVWNDDSSADGLSSTGGGTSIYTARPSWQTGVIGIPSGSYRLVPDISLDSSPNNAGYLYCSSDSNSTGISGSCSNGFRDSNDEYLTVAGGTSFAAPIFAGMLSLINQKLSSTGQGVINSTLYSLASNATTYASVFHDITSGTNACTAGSSYCNAAGESQYAATTGYDEATGLGSIDLYKLLTGWPASSSDASLASSITTLSATTSTPASGASDVVTITVASNSSSVTATPTGTLTILVDGTTTSSSLNLSGGSAQYTFSSTTSGSHVIQATYSGDSTYATSSGSLTLTIGSTASTTKAFSVSGTNLTISDGSSGTSTVTVTPLGGYTGTVQWSVASNSSLSNACYSISNTSVTSAAAVATVLTIYTSESDCSSASVQGAQGARRSFVTPSLKSAQAVPMVGRGSTSMGAIFLSSLLFCFLIVRKPKRLSLLILPLGLIGASVLSGCGDSSSTAASSDATKGTYQLTVTGTDSVTSSITSSTSLTLTID